MASEPFEAMIEEVPLGLLLVKANGTITVINGAALDLLSLPRRIAEQARLTEVLPQVPPDLMAPGAAVARLTLDDREILLTARPFRGSEQERLITMQDVTSQGAIERIKSAFVSDLLHKIRTPLTTIKSSLSTLANPRLDPATVDARELLDMSRAETDRLVRVIDDIRDLFLVDTGLMSEEIEIETVEVGALLRHVHESFLAEAAEAGLAMDEPVNSEESRVHADRVLLERAIRKVVQNAIRYTPRGGHVSMGMHRRGDHVEIVLSDDGPGMPEDVEFRAFDRFFRGTAATKHVPDGVGLGLTIARDLVRLMGGEVTLETAPGSGTRVSFLLPLAIGER